jgi:adenosylhomocysteine nucleosidase
MRIGVMGALPEEVALVRARLTDARTVSLGLREYHSGRLLGHEITTVFSRAGKVAAASTATTLVERFGVDLVLFTGVAGATATDLRTGDVVVASQLLQYDLDVSPLSGFDRFDVPLLGCSRFASPSGLVELGCEAVREYLRSGRHAPVAPGTLAAFGIEQPEVRSGLVASGDRFVAGAEERERLMSLLPDLLCVEMEGAALAQVCYEHGTPFLVVRTLSGHADRGAPDFHAFLEQVASRFACGIALELIGRLETSSAQWSVGPRRQPTTLGKDYWGTMSR